MELKCSEAPVAKPVEMCLDRAFVFVVAISDGIPLFRGYGAVGVNGVIKTSG